GQTSSQDDGYRANPAITPIVAACDSFSLAGSRPQCSAMARLPLKMTGWGSPRKLCHAHRAGLPDDFHVRDVHGIRHKELRSRIVTNEMIQQGLRSFTNYLCRHPVPSTNAS